MMETVGKNIPKNQIKQAIVEAIKDQVGIRKIIIFGSFLVSDTPGDIDVAVLGVFPQGYLETAITLRRKVRHIANILPIDIVPIREDVPGNTFVQEIQKGEVIYERGNPTMA